LTFYIIEKLCLPDIRGCVEPNKETGINNISDQLYLSSNENAVFLKILCVNFHRRTKVDDTPVYQKTVHISLLFFIVLHRTRTAYSDEINKAK
jgi:hypothetical protein